MSCWIGVDLDGTLAFDSGWLGPDEIGIPIPQMLDRVKRWLDEGRDVRIFTARVSMPEEEKIARKAIEKWCKKHVGRVLPVTCVKDMHMLELWDDRAICVHHNTGEVTDMHSSLIERYRSTE